MSNNAWGNPQSEVFNQLLKDRIVVLGSEVEDDIANLIIAQLLYLEKQDEEKYIWLYINSPGGVITSGMAIYDTMQFVKPDVATTCVGVAMSMGSLILTGGAAGKRSALPNSRILIHQPSGGYEGKQADIEVHAREILELRRRTDEIYAQHTGQTVEQVHDDMERDRYMTPEQAADYGLIDRVCEWRKGNGNGNGNGQPVSPSSSSSSSSPSSSSA